MYIVKSAQTAIQTHMMYKCILKYFIYVSDSIQCPDPAIAGYRETDDQAIVERQYDITLYHYKIECGREGCVFSEQQHFHCGSCHACGQVSNI